MAKMPVEPQEHKFSHCRRTQKLIENLLVPPEQIVRDPRYTKNQRVAENQIVSVGSSRGIRLEPRS